MTKTLFCFCLTILAKLKINLHSFGSAQKSSCVFVPRSGNNEEPVLHQACTAALPADACQISHIHTQGSRDHFKSQTINSPRFGSVVNAQTVRSAGL